MGDVDWSKRSYPGYGGANAFSSMGDVDWRKRSVGAARQFGDDEDHEKVKKAGGLYRNWLSGGYKPGIRQSTYQLVVFSCHRACEYSSYSTLHHLTIFNISHL